MKHPIIFDYLIAGMGFKSGVDPLRYAAKIHGTIGRLQLALLLVAAFTVNCVQPVSLDKACLHMPDAVKNKCSSLHCQKVEGGGLRLICKGLKTRDTSPFAQRPQPTKNLGKKSKSNFTSE